MSFLRTTGLRGIFHPLLPTGHSFSPPSEAFIDSWVRTGLCHLEPQALSHVPSAGCRISLPVSPKLHRRISKIQTSLFPVIPFLGLCPQLLGTGSSISVMCVFVQLREKGPANTCKQLQSLGWILLPPSCSIIHWDVFDS